MLPLPDRRLESLHWPSYIRVSCGLAYRFLSVNVKYRKADLLALFYIAYDLYKLSLDHEAELQVGFELCGGTEGEV